MIKTFLSIFSFGVMLLPLSIVIDMTKNDDKSPFIFLYLLQFGTLFYSGLYFFCMSIGVIK